MPMAPFKIENTARPSVVSIGTSALNVASTGTSEPNEGDDFQVVPLDQLKVAEGVFRRDEINSSEELTPGDEFHFPQSEAQSRASCITKASLTSIQVFTGNRFGLSSFNAAITHTVIFMSEIGQQLCGYVLDGSENATTRPSVILRGVTNFASNYTLIDLSDGRKELGWPVEMAAGGLTGAPLSGSNNTLGAAI